MSKVRLDLYSPENTLMKESKELKKGLGDHKPTMYSPWTVEKNPLSLVPEGHIGLDMYILIFVVLFFSSFITKYISSLPSVPPPPPPSFTHPVWSGRVYTLT